MKKESYTSAVWLSWISLFFFFTTVGFEKKNLLPSNVDTRSVSCAVQEKKGGGSGTSMENEKKNKVKNASNMYD